MQWKLYSVLQYFTTPPPPPPFNSEMLKYVRVNNSDIYIRECFVTFLVSSPQNIRLEAMNHLVHMGNSFTLSEEHSAKPFEEIKCFLSVWNKIKPSAVDFNQKLSIYCKKKMTAYVNPQKPREQHRSRNQLRSDTTLNATFSGRKQLSGNVSIQTAR